MSKKPGFWVIVLAVMATVVLMVVFSTNPQQEPLIYNLYEGYSLDALMDNKTPYAGNNVKVIGLIDATPLPAGIIRDTVELQTDSLPYGITINYIMNDSYNVLLVNGAINGEAFYRNAIILFSLIDNVDVINCKIADKTGQNDGALYTFTYTREMTEELIGEDVRSFAASADSLKELIDRVKNTPLGPNLASPLTANSQIEEYLELIISSPGTSSNPHDYIKAHRNEYDAIIKMDAEALPYLFSEFEKGGQTGLKGHIMESLCRNILGGEDISYENTDPQDWYYTYKAHMLGILEKNSLEFIKSNNPKGSIVLNDIQKAAIETKVPYDFSLLYSYKNISSNDSNKVRELVNQLQYARELPIDRIEFESENEEILRIDYRMNLSAGQEYKVNHTKKMADAVILFALLDDLNAVEYNLVQEDYGYGGVPLTREQAEQVLGADIGSLGKTKKVFLSEMPKIIAGLQWNPGVMDIITYEHIMR